MGPYVSSNPMHDPNAPRSKDMTNQGSVPLVFAPGYAELCTAMFGFAFAFAIASPLLRC